MLHITKDVTYFHAPHAPEHATKSIFIRYGSKTQLWVYHERSKKIKNNALRLSIENDQSEVLSNKLTSFQSDMR